MKIKNTLALFIAFLFPFQGLSALSSQKGFYNKTNKEILLAQNENFGDHNHDNSDNSHSENHNSDNHYHLIKSVKVKSNGLLKVKFCEKVDSLEGYIKVQNVNYDIEDAYKITKKSITWRPNNKDIFSKGSLVELSTLNLIGRPSRKDSLYAVQTLERGCGLIGAYIPNAIEVKGQEGVGGALLGIALIVGIGMGSGGSGSGSSSSN